MAKAKVLLIGEAGTGKTMLASTFNSDVEVVEKQVIHSKDELYEFDQVCLFNINKQTVDVLGLRTSLYLQDLRFFTFTKDELLNNDINELVSLRKPCLVAQQEQANFYRLYKNLPLEGVGKSVLEKRLLNKYFETK